MTKPLGGIQRKPTGAQRPRAAPLPPAEPEIAALDHACKPAVARVRKLRAERKAGIVALAAVPITRDFVGVLISAGLLAHEDRCNRAAVVAATQSYWRLHIGL